MKFDDIIDKVRAAEGWLTNREARFLYKTALAVDPKKGTIVEIGSYKGKSTLCLGAAAQENDGEVWAIDPHFTNVEQRLSNNNRSSFDDFKKTVDGAGLVSVVKPIVKRSWDFVSEWTGEPIAFLWIDGDHSYEGARRDFDEWSPFVIDGGIVAFHDSTYDHVQRVVRDTIASPYFSHLGLADSITFAKKRSTPASWRQRLRTRFVLSMSWAEDKARHIPLPKRLRSSMKGVAKRVFSTVN